MIETAASAAPRTARRPVRRSVSAIVLAALALDVAANSVLPPRLHVPIGLVTAGGISWLAAKAGVSLEEQGLGANAAPRGVVYGASISLPVGLLLAGASQHGRLRTFYQQESIAAAGPWRATYEAFIRIPLGTALPEELIFRGVAIGMLSSRRSPLTTLLVSSALFGLWHIAPSAQRLDETTYVKSRPVLHRLGHVAGAVASTAVAGLGLGWLRMRSGSIIAPWTVHATANSSAYLASWIAGRADSGQMPIVVEEASTARASSTRSPRLRTRT